MHTEIIFAQLIEAMGGRVKGEVLTDGAKAIAAGGSIIHEVGGASMGTDAKESVTNRWGQAWDVGNLFITDGAVFPSNADKNPTLTIMALAWRALPHRILELMRRKELSPRQPLRVDRRTAFKWVLAAWAGMPLEPRAFAAETASATEGYGTDPDLTKIYQPGELWPLTLTEVQRRTAAALCDVIIPGGC